MEQTYINILKKIEKNGFVAYIVGGYVRDFLLGIKTTDVDITTNATPKDLKTIFKNVESEYVEYGAVKLHINDQRVDITTFRKELSYISGKPNEIEYTSSLEEDLKRRDFTINTFVMDSESNIIDLLDAKEDLDNRVIKTIRDVNIEFIEDPTRALRALRFMSVLDFKLDPNIIDFIINNKDIFRRINIVKKKEELDKLFKTKKVSKFMSFIKEKSLEEYIGFKVPLDFKETDSVIGVYSQIEILDEFNFTKYEKEQIKEIKCLLLKKSIDKIDIYEKGLYIATIAADLMSISKKEINNMYKLLPIHSIKDIDITSEEICEILKIKPSKKLGDIIKYIEKEIIKGTLSNNKEEIIKFIRR